MNCKNEKVKSSHLDSKIRFLFISRSMNGISQLLIIIYFHVKHNKIKYSGPAIV